MSAHQLFFAGLQAIGRLRPRTDYDRLVFVVGSGRCGSTLLTRVLESSPSVLMLPTELNGYFHRGQYPYRQSMWPATPPIVEDPLAFTRQSLVRWPANAARLRRLVDGAMLVAGRRTVVIKSAMVSHMVDDIAETFPGARFLHVHRHGLPVVNSFVKKEHHKYAWRFPDVDAFRLQAAGYWSSCIDAILSSSLFSGDGRGKTCVMRYEDLMAQPEREIERLAEFVAGVNDFDFDVSTIVARHASPQDMVEDETPVNAAMRPQLQALGYVR